MKLEYIQRTCGVPAEIGRRVKMDGRPGIIAADRGNYVGVNFDADKPGVIKNCHPVWKMEYGEMGTLRPMTRSQKRYQEFLSADSGLTFFEFLKWRHANKERLVELGYTP